MGEALETIDAALALAGDDPAVGAGIAFRCPLAQAFGDRAQSIGYLGELATARRDFDRGIELAREHDDPETQSAGYAKRAVFEADVGAIEAALDYAARGLAIAEPAGNTIHAIACSTPMALAEVAAGRFADGVARAETNLAAIREHGIGLYYEPVLLATVARAKLALGQPDDALAAAEEAVAIMDARGLTTCALQAPITLAQVLLATDGAAAGERIASVLGRALQVARASGARVFEAPIQRELATAARLRGDGVSAPR
jgi:tetratricopeptide (TPR) repeat protein